MLFRALRAVVFVAPLVFVAGLQDPANLPQSIFVQMASVLLLLAWLRDAAPGLGARTGGPELPLAAFVAWALASLSWATNRYEALLTVSQWACCALVFVVVARSALAPTHVRKISSALVVGAALVSAVGLAQQLGFDWLPQAAAPAATFVNKNIAAQFLLPILPVSVHLFVADWRRPAGWGFALSSGLIGAFLFQAGSRSAGLAIAVSAVAVAGMAVRGARWPRSLPRIGVEPASLVMALALILGIWLVSSLPGAAMRMAGDVEAALAAPEDVGALEPARQSVALRLQLWRHALGMIADRPVLGVGAGNFKIEYPRFSSARDPSMADPRLQPEAAHNDYLQLACELGFVGVALAFWLGRRVLGAWRAAVAADQPPEQRRLAIALGAGLLASCIDAFFSFPLERALPLFVAAVWAGVLGSWRPVAGVSPSLRPRGSTRWRALAAAALVAVSLWGGLQVAADWHVMRMAEAEARGDWPAVVRAGERALALNPFRSGPLFLIATAQLQLGAPVAAAAALERLLDAYPFHLNAVGNLGLAYLGVGRLEGARACFDRVLAIRPRDPIALLALRRMLGLRAAQARANERPAGSCGPQVEVASDGLGLVDVRAREARLSSILDCLAERTGMTVVYNTQPAQRITVTLVKQTVHEAVLRLLEGTGLNYAIRLDRTGRRIETLWLENKSAAPATVARPAPSAPPEPPPRTVDLPEGVFHSDPEPAEQPDADENVFPEPRPLTPSLVNRR